MAVQQELTKSSAWQDYRELLALSVPVFIGSISSNLLGLVDSALMGRHSVPGLAAAAAGSAVFSLLTSIVFAATMAHQIVAARRFGGQDLKGVGTSFWHTFVLAGSLGIFLMLAVWWGGPWIAEILGKEPGLRVGTLLYMRARSPELVLMVPLALLQMTFSADKQTRWGMYASFVINGSNILYDYPLIFGLGPIPAMGVMGNGVGTSLATLTGLIFLTISAIRRGLLVRIKPQSFRLRAEELRMIGKLGLPIMGSAFFDYIANLLLFGLIAAIGAVHLAASRIAFNLDMMLFAIAMSLAMGGQILVGRFWGAHDMTRAQHFLGLNRRLSLVVLSLVGLPLALFPSHIIGIFTPFPEIQQSGAAAVRLIGLMAPAIAWACSNVSVLRALGRTKSDMYANVVPIWILQLPLGWLIGVWMGWGLFGIYLGFAAYWIARGVMAHVMVARAFSLEMREIPT